LVIIICWKPKEKEVSISTRKNKNYFFLLKFYYFFLKIIYNKKMAELNNYYSA